jgi:urease accessory protein UreH
LSEILIEDEAGKPLAVDRLRIDGEAFAKSCPGVSGRYAAQGTLVVAGRDLASRDLEDALNGIKLERDVALIGFSLLPHSAGVLVRVLAADGAALKSALHQAWCATRLVLKGSHPVERRK